MAARAGHAGGPGVHGPRGAPTSRAAGCQDRDPGHTSRNRQHPDRRLGRREPDGGPHTVSPKGAPPPRFELDEPHGDRVLVIIPTYDERENLPRIVERLFASVPGAHVLVADDGSPDGTGDVADELAARNERVHVMHRTEKAGLGAAYVAGFGWGLDNGYDVLVEMDADGSHPPEQLPRLLDALQRADLVLGSRYVAGGEVVDWPWRREWLSRGGNLYCRLALGVRIYDITGGYRAYRAEVLKPLAPAHRHGPAQALTRVDSTTPPTRSGRWRWVVRLSSDFRRRCGGPSVRPA